ncbi:MAG: hypothetical protein M0R22_02820 [Dehalococcoidia bacterium]|nr:hypothetical protein [Dehalococcoidia bacterium]
MGLRSGPGASWHCSTLVCPSGKVTKPELRAFCARSVADFKLPQRIEFMAELPKIASGKVDRRALMQTAGA